MINRVSNRRGVLAGLAAAPFGGAVAAAVAADPDATLLALGTRFEAAWAHERKTDARFKGDLSAEAVAACEAAYAATGLIAEEIEPIRANTLAGLYVRARVLLWCMGSDPLIAEQFSDSPPATDVRMIVSLAQDVLRIGAAP
ncbi:hypothetical protein [Methylobacterium sp. CCH5-D2]|uniref:hypothetical protein n=1 Tax=Methylobacterium sp. CCH5-D2 TaxID=1768765 RepID=UPI0012E3ED9A|nr:hypothetical protein [Methylobacterium sp. CCH5-D2]